MKYQIIQYENGLGEKHFVVKRVGLFFNTPLRCKWAGDSFVREFSTFQDAHAAALDDSQVVKSMREARASAKKVNKKNITCITEVDLE